MRLCLKALANCSSSSRSLGSSCDGIDMCLGICKWDMSMWFSIDGPARPERLIAWIRETSQKNLQFPGDVKTTTAGFYCPVPKQWLWWIWWCPQPLVFANNGGDFSMNSSAAHFCPGSWCHVHQASCTHIKSRIVLFESLLLVHFNVQVLARTFCAIFANSTILYSDCTFNWINIFFGHLVAAETSCKCSTDL